MNLESQQKLAKEFLAMHHAPEIFILAGAWDVSSAKIFEQGGFEALGTTSAGIATSLGFADGEQMSLADSLAVVKRIVVNTALPVSADIEAGYAKSIDDIIKTTKAVIASGAVGLNIEDSTADKNNPIFDQDVQTAKIRAIRQTANASNISLVINARLDSMMLSTNAEEEELENTIRRANAYVNAGADCIFVPDSNGLKVTTIRQLVARIDAPLNLILGPDMPSISVLQDLGVARVSLGPRPMRAVLSKLQEIVAELLSTGSCDKMSSTLSYSEINNWFNKKNNLL